MSKANFDHLVFAQNYAIKISAAYVLGEKTELGKKK